MRFRFARQTLWIAANLIGAATFLYYVSAAWIDPDTYIPGTNGGAPFVWFSFAFPFIVAFSLAHLIAGTIALIVLFQRGQSGWLVGVMCTAATWTGALWFDGIHHGN